MFLCTEIIGISLLVSTAKLSGLQGWILLFQRCKPGCFLDFLVDDIWWRSFGGINLYCLTEDSLRSLVACRRGFKGGHWWSFEESPIAAPVNDDDIHRVRDSEEFDLWDPSTILNEPSRGWSCSLIVQGFWSCGTKIMLGMFMVDR